MQDDDQDYRYDCHMNGNVEGFPPEPQAPGPAKSGVFSYDDKNGIRVGSFSRASLGDLHLLFRKNASPARLTAATKPWIVAQLRVYDIPFRKSANVDELRSMLKAAVKGRKAVEKYKFDVGQCHKQNFPKLNNISVEARYDLDSFCSKYFVEDKGLPAPDRTPKPVVLWDLNDWSELLRCRLDAIPGLSARATSFLTVIAWGPELKRGVDTAFTMIDSPDVNGDHLTLEALFDPDRFLAKYFFNGLRGEPNRSETCVIVGWAKQVNSQMESWKLKIAQLEGLYTKQKERDKEKAILAKLKPHIDYARAHRSPSSNSSTLNRLVGSCIMHCRRLQDNYGAELGSMTLDIHQPTTTHGIVAAFDFGLMNGTMLVVTSEASLELLREEQAVRSSDEEEPADSEYFTSSSKRKAAASRHTGAKHFKRRLGGSHSKNPGRIYLQGAACEAGTGRLVLDEDHERTGHFDLDKSGLTARGQFYYHAYFSEKPVVFTLLKIADKPKRQPDEWSSYCERERR
ncbi:hypothetical protein GGS24DRAFT_494773 [Hypoxylon argillaceum]|nr:hypothetical protein GGS24DRAFT_494773 [Hypoxylon argillaceum]